MFARYFYKVLHVAPTQVDPDTPYPLNEHDYFADVWSCVVANWFGLGSEKVYSSCDDRGWILLTDISKVTSKGLNTVLFNAVRAYILNFKLSIRESKEKVKEVTKAILESNEDPEEVLVELPPNVILFPNKRGILR